MAKSPNWTASEILILTNEYVKHGCTAELKAMLPGRSSIGISIKARKLGLKILDNPRRRISNEEYLIKLEKTNFISLEEYAGSTTPILHKCKRCNLEWNTRPQHALTVGANCPNCDISIRKNSIEKVDSVLQTAGILRIGEYTGSLDSIKVKHLACGHEWLTVYSYIQQGSGCPVCNKGFGYKVKELIPHKAKIYLLSVVTDKEQYLKIGVTVQSVSKRINSIKCSMCDSTVSIKLLHTVEGTGKAVLKAEALILNTFTRYTTLRLFDGYTETLSVTNNIEDIKKIMNEII